MKELHGTECFWYVAQGVSNITLGHFVLKCQQSIAVGLLLDLMDSSICVFQELVD